MELLTEDIIIEALDSDGIMQEPDANWLIEYIESEYGGNLDNTTDWVDKRHILKIYSESTCDSYDIYWCTHDERPYVSQDGYYYEDYAEWSERAIEEMTSGGAVWVEPHLWSELTLSDISSLLSYSGLYTSDVTAKDIMYGGRMLIEE